MENQEIRSMLEVIDQEISSAILGGMEEKFEELERLGYVTINRHDVQHSASLTPEGLEFLHQPRTDRTGSNRPVHTGKSVIVKKEDDDRLSDEPDSLGVDRDDTNPGSRSHPTDS